MLVRPHPAGWRITLHPAHGLLAAELYRQLTDRPTDELDLPTLLAVAEHDDHQLDFEAGNYLTERGAPRDFTQLETTDAQRSIQAERLLQEAYRKHLWTGLLIGEHYTFLYGKVKTDARLRKLLDHIAEKRTQCLAARQWKASRLSKAYGQLRFCDRLSLILCGEELPTPGRELEINDALGKPHYVSQREEGSVHVRPWPFASETFTVSVESFVLAQLSYTDSAALGRQLAATLPELRSWSFANDPSVS